MRVMLTGLLVAGGVVAGTAHGGQPSDPPPGLDVASAVDRLADQRVVRAPGAVATFDENRVRAELGDDARLLVAPYAGPFGTGGTYADGETHAERVTAPLDAWATARGEHLVVVEGIDVSLYGERDGGASPANVPELRQQTAYLDVTTAVLTALRRARGEPAGDHPAVTPVPPTREQVDALAARLRTTRVHNAPGRDDPVDPRMARLAQEYGIGVRIVALPTPQLGQPLVDYAPGLRELFPDDVVMVAQGRWLDVAAREQAKAESARNHAYGRFEYASFLQGSRMQDRIGTVLDRLRFLLADTAYGRPQPQPQPEPRPYDVRRTISALAPWVLLGAAAVLAGTALVRWRWARARRAAAELGAMRRQRAVAVARIGELGARLLAVEEGGGAVNPAAAERHATARALYDEAVTAGAMAEVAAIAEEGLAAGVTA